jgi:hypothetical protein
MLIRSVAFPVLSVRLGTASGLCGARRLRSCCFALALFRFWLGTVKKIERRNHLTMIL